MAPDSPKAEEPKSPKQCPKCGAAKDALEDAWVSVMAFASGCWDTLDGLEEAIGAITGETDKQVSQRLYAANKSFIRSRNCGQDQKRQKAKAEIASLRKELEEAQARIAELEAIVDKHKQVLAATVDVLLWYEDENERWERTEDDIPGDLLELESRRDCAVEALNEAREAAERAASDDPVPPDTAETAGESDA